MTRNGGVHRLVIDGCSGFFSLALGINRVEPGAQCVELIVGGIQGGGDGAILIGQPFGYAVLVECEGSYRHNHDREGCNDSTERVGRTGNRRGFVGHARFSSAHCLATEMPAKRDTLIN